jgi:lysylphosphatidylglycerol synthetase-like protein (DUF2156 family)
MTAQGLIIGVGAFLIIGLLHPVVVRGEYHFGKGIWPAFLVLGVACIVASLFAGSVMVSALLAVLGFSLLWSIRELFEQEERVRKGWFPQNPRRVKTDEGRKSDS